MPVSAEKEKALALRMRELGVSERDIEESFVRSSGPGGQKVNKTSTCVQLTHLPTGLTVKCRRERSQSLNRHLARRLLLNKIEERQKGFVAAEKEKAEKIRRQKRKRSQRAKGKMLDEKKRLSQKKELRGRVGSDET